MTAVEAFNCDDNYTCEFEPQNKEVQLMFVIVASVSNTIFTIHSVFIYWRLLILEIVLGCSSSSCVLSRDKK